MTAISLALVVNAGGASRRMGEAKALLHVPPHDTPLIVEIVRRLAPLATEGTLVITGDLAIARAVEALPDVNVVADLWVEGGALGGVATGLTYSEAWAMVVACDMPLVSPDIFAALIQIATDQPDADAVIPFVAGQVQPFHGLWHTRALPTLVQCLAAGELRVQHALARLNVVWVDEVVLGIDTDLSAFDNVNTPEEWATMLTRLQAKEER